MNVYLAVDIGASGGRHIAGWLEDGRLRTKEVYRFENGATVKNGHLCWDAEGLFAHVVAGLKAAVREGLTPVSVGIDTWAVDFVLLDGEDRMLGDLVAYRDNRTAQMDTELEKVLPFARHYAITGIAKQPFNTVYQMMAVLREHPEWREEARDFLMVPEWLSWRLTGVRKHEWTNISTTALADAATRSWSAEVLEKAGIPAHWTRTPIVAPGTPLGLLKQEIAAEVGCAPTVVLSASHDTGSAYVAVPAETDSAVFLSSGTWSLLGTELKEPVTGEAALQAGFTNEGGVSGSVRFLKNIMGMWMLQCLRHEYQDRWSYAEMAEMAAASAYPAFVNATDNRYLAPASMKDEILTALREQGAPEPASPGDLFRAVTVGLAECYAKAIQEMSAVTGKPFSVIHIVGGGSQNVTLDRLTAERTRLPVCAGPTEGTALGNLGVQMIASGVFPSVAAFRAILAKEPDLTRY